MQIYIFQISVGQTTGASDGMYFQLLNIGTASMGLRYNIRKNSAWSPTGPVYIFLQLYFLPNFDLID